MMIMCRVLRSALLDALLGLKLLGRSLLDPMVVVPGEVWVVLHMTLHLLAVALRPAR